MIHNGVLDIDVPNNSKLNDTRIYINNYLMNFTTFDIMNNTALKNLIEFSIKGNKFVFLDNEGNYNIMNEQAGTWENGVWYSNSSHSYGSLYDDYFFGYGIRSKKQAKKLIQQQYYYFESLIDDLDYEDYLSIGDEPYFDFDDYMFIGFKFGDNCYKLKSLNEWLYNRYMESYNAVLSNYAVECAG